MKKNLDLGLLILRLSIGGLMLFHGFAKFGGSLEFIAGLLKNIGLPGFFSYGVLVGEIIAPIAIIIGFRTRLSALVFSLNCVVAIALAHSGDIFKLSSHGGWALELLGLFLFGAIALFFTGGGKIAVSSRNNWD